MPKLNQRSRMARAGSAFVQPQRPPMAIQTGLAAVGSEGDCMTFADAALLLVASALFVMLARLDAAN